MVNDIMYRPILKVGVIQLRQTALGMLKSKKMYRGLFLMILSLETLAVAREALKIEDYEFQLA